ncbi:hypothetical protein Esi_0051_0071 [Ectocarpus siliculosus]|uniref:Uncharacterized protein n=1 Tax=Ectocarpus siliculosus TaxID=2880 RepID=D7G3I3_ECTSI|nr:hypothetical protein Esi_0051_0071 [Ectocarpus siliculosus]|eukprot:CBJ26981.1 hypothetical protein Esi_0051_0071 [Ectocarpus siliculosus]
MLGEAGAGEIFVADGVGKVKRRTVSRKAASKRGKKMAKGQTTAKGGKTDSNSSDENQDDSARKRKSSEKKPWQRSTGRSRSMTVVDVAMAAMQKKREARLKARAMLKDARGLILKGRMNRAHAALCEAVACNEAPHLLVILSELRARVRAALGLWDEAGEDVRVALKGLEQGEGVGVDDVDSDEERTEIQWLQDTGQFAAAVLAAREMDAQVKRHIHDQHLQGGGGGDQEIAGESRGGDGEPNLGSILFQDVQSEDDDQGETYEAAVWAKVAIADLATRNMGQRHEKDKKTKGTTGGGTGGAFGERQASLRNKAKRAKRKRAVQGGKPGGGNDNGAEDGAATHETPDAENKAPSAAAVAMSSLTTSVKHVVIDTGDGDKQQDDSSGGQPTTVGLSDVGTHKTHTEEQGEQTASAVKPATTVVAAAAAETTDSASPTKPHHQGQQPEQRCLEAAEHARSGGEKGDNTPPASGGHDQVCDAEGEEQTTEEKKGKTHVTKQSTKVGAVAAAGSDGSMPVIDSAVDGGHGDIAQPKTDGGPQKKHAMGDEDGLGNARLDKEHNKEGEGEGTGEESDNSIDLERPQGKEHDDGKGGEQRTTEGENDHTNVVGKEQEFAVMEEETEGEETEEEESEEEEEEREEEEEDAERLAKTDEDNRCNLEAAIDSLQLLLGDERMAWRADVRTPRVLATAIEKLADLSQRPANDDRADKTMDLPGTRGGAGAATEGQPIKKRPSTRQEILQSGEESLRGVFAVLEGKLSSLVAEWKPRWKSHCQAKNIPIRREGGGGVGGGWNKMRAKMKRGGKGGSRRSLPDVVHGILVSAAEAGVDIEKMGLELVEPTAAKHQDPGATTAEERPTTPRRSHG